MDFKEYLLSLQWNTFVKYPDQGKDIYLHCFSDDGTIHKFFKVNQFNAVSFDFQKIVNKYSNKLRWQFSWLPAEKIDESYDNDNFD